MAKDIANIHAICEDGFAVTPSDVDELTHCPAVLYVGVAGNVKVKTKKGSDLTFVGVLGSVVLPVKVTMVYSTGTTATNILALY